MKNFLCCALAAFLLCLFTQTALASSDNDTAYLAAVDKMRSAEKTEVADWTNLRNLYTQTSFYLEAAGFVPVSLGDTLENAYTQKTEAALQALDTLRRQYYAALETHIALANFHHEKDPKPDFINLDKEMESINHIFESILTTGSGKNMKEAITAISIFEQQALIQARFSLRIVSKSLENANGKIYDVYQVKYDGKGTMEMFFDISKRMAAFKRSKMATNAKAVRDEEMKALDVNGAEEPPAAPAARKIPEADSKYAALVDAARKDPAKADWAAMRKLFPQTLHFKSVGWDALTEKSNKMFQYVRNRETDESFKWFNNYLNDFYASPGAHRAALSLAEKYPDRNIDTAASKAALEGLLKAIMATTDGTSTETAIMLNSGEELSEVLKEHFKLQDIQAPETTVKEGKIYMHYMLKSPQTGEQKRYYFTVDTEALGRTYAKGIESSASAEAAVTRGPKEQAYEQMVEDARKAPEKTDWAALRTAYTHTMYYQPYSGVTLAEKLSQLAAAAKSGDRKAADAYQKLYLLHFAHFLVQDNAVRMAGDAGIVSVSPSLAHTAFDGLIAVLKNSGDGKSAQTAYQVIDIQEEYFILRQMEDKYKKRPVSFIDNRAYDIFDPVEPGEGKGALYFDVTVLFQK